MKPVNRILLAFKDWTDKKNELAPLLKSENIQERTVQKLQLEHLRQANHRLRGVARPDEKPFMVLLGNAISRLEKQLYPNPLQRLFSRIKDRFYVGPVYLEDLAQQRMTNMAQLKQQLQEKGLGAIAGKLEQHLNSDHKQAVLALDAQLGPDKRLNFDLFFEKDVYGDFQLRCLEGTLIDKGEIAERREFQLEEWPVLTAKQAHNLLEGRAIKQEFTDALGRQSERWVALGAQENNNFHYYPTDYPFDLAGVLNALPNITRDREELIRSLENGQQIATHWKQDGHFQNIYVQADPAHRTVRLFDAKQRPVTAEQLNKLAQQHQAKRSQASNLTVRKSHKNGHQVH